MRLQRLSGASFQMREPYHGLMSQTGSFVRMALSRFVRAPAALSGQQPLFAFDGVALGQHLCSSSGGGDGNDGGGGGVLAAECSDLGDFVTPASPSAFNATACAWPGEQLRPTFMQWAGDSAERCGGSVEPPSGGGARLGDVASGLLAVALLFACAALVKLLRDQRRAKSNPVAARLP